MAEEKRIFNGAAMDRDIDDRLLPAGKYRYGLNINIGESEGGDIGTLENLKGNEIITGQDTIEGTTIGSIRDPNNDRFYWFTKGATVDAIYEYDGTSVNTILKDSVARDNVKPTCAPSFTTFINDPVSDASDRPDIDFTYRRGIGGCTDPTANNFDATATFDDGSCTFDPVVPPTTLGVSIAGAGTFANTDSPVTLTATPANVLGTASFLWDTGETTSTLSVSGADQTITGSVTVTDSGRTTGNTATANYSVTFQAAAPVRSTWGFSTAASTLAGTTTSGSAAGVETTIGTLFDVGARNDTSMIAIDSPTTMRWLTLPTAALSSAPTGVTLGAVSGTIGTSTAVNAALQGSYTPTQAESPIVTWSGGSIEMIPAMFAGSVAISTWPDYIISTSGSGDVTGTSVGSDQATYTFSNLPAGVFLFNAAISWSSPSLGNFFTENRSISTILSNPATAGFNIDFPDTLPADFTETLTATITITVSGGAFDGTNVPITAGATQTSSFA